MNDQDYKILALSLPDDPGVYRFYSADNDILYVGKAKNLKNRISNYFGDKKHMPFKARTMVRHAVRLEYTIVETEHDALLLENTLIKKHQPRYNVMLKDGKTYAYICVKNEYFPRVFFTRKLIKDGSTYFGPYTSKFRAEIMLDLVKQLFPLRTCSLPLSPLSIEKHKFKVCLEYHIKNCMGPCEGYESESIYLEKINQIKNILKGNLKVVKSYIQQEMKQCAEDLAYEQAHMWKVKLEAFEDYQSKSSVVSPNIDDVDVFSIETDEKIAYVNYLKVIQGAIVNTFTIELVKNLDEDKTFILNYAVHHIREKYMSIAPEIIVPFPIEALESNLNITIPQRGEKKQLLELSEKNVKYFMLQKQQEASGKNRKQTAVERILKTIQEDLHMDTVPFHIECFDNSNIQGTHPVAACVVFKNAQPSKSDYRHFHIKTVVGPNDFASMEEVVYRRYKRLLEEEQSLPQLIIIDGGKGQLSAAMKSIEKLELQDKIKIVGIAKKLEEIFFPNDSIPLYINKKSESLKIIQQLRNEAHRFAISFHRNTRSKNFLQSELFDIPGIGKKTAEKLLKEYGSVQQLRTINQEQLEAFIGKSMTKKLGEYFESRNT